MQCMVSNGRYITNTIVCAPILNFIIPPHILTKQSHNLSTNPDARTLTALDSWWCRCDRCAAQSASAQWAPWSRRAWWSTCRAARCSRGGEWRSGIRTANDCGSATSGRTTVAATGTPPRISARPQRERICIVGRMEHVVGSSGCQKGWMKRHRGSSAFFEYLSCVRGLCSDLRTHWRPLFTCKVRGVLTKLDSSGDAKLSSSTLTFTVNVPVRHAIPNQGGDRMRRGKKTNSTIVQNISH